MAYTFGAATGDNVNFNSTAAALISNSTWAVAGWFYPTTLTAGRTLWSAGATANCAVIGATTSELELFVASSTTQGKWTTSGLALTVNVWRFVAVVISVHDTGPLMSCRVWAGATSTVPVEITASQTTAPVGTMTGAASYYIGNKGAGALAFQGDIESVDFLYGGGTTTNSTILIPAAHGSVTQAEADLFLALYVMPLWQGDHYAIDRGRGGSLQSSLGKWFVELAPLGLAVGRPTNVTTSPEAALTVTTATVSQNHGPQPPISRPFWPARRR